MDILKNTILLAAAQAEPMERLFDLDLQLLADAAIIAVAVFILFLVLSYLLFNPARDLLKKRQEKIKSDLETAEQEKTTAIDFKDEYEAKLSQVGKEEEDILSNARKRAAASEAKVIEEARQESIRIIERAKEEARLEKQKAADDMKKEMIQIASLMAGKVVSASIDTTVQDALVEETLKEMGEDTWLS